jgi:hypothetical protein
VSRSDVPFLGAAVGEKICTSSINDIVSSMMAKHLTPESTEFMRVAVLSVRKLKKAFEDQEIYVAANSSTSVVPFCHVSKAFQTHNAVVTLCRAGLQRVCPSIDEQPFVICDDRRARSNGFAHGSSRVPRRKIARARDLPKPEPLVCQISGVGATNELI